MIKIKDFIKRNAMYLVLVFCVLAVGLSAAFMLISDIQSGDISVDMEIEDNNPPKEEENDQPTIEIITFCLPVENPTSIEDYSEQMVFNSTLNRYDAHLGIDFFAPEGTEAKATYKGVVESIEKDLLEGLTITIDHGNGLKTIYNSISEENDLVVGQSVETGETIGTVSVSNRLEYKKGPHLHFEVLENGKLIDPVKYLNISEK